MTPEQAAEKAAEALAMAADNALVPGVAGAYVGIADGWTRLYTALTDTPSLLPLMTIEPEVKVGDYAALAQDVERSLREMRATARVPRVGNIVHYVSYGTPRGEYPSECRAAIITGVDDYQPNGGGGGLHIGHVSLAVLNPEGTFFNRAVLHDEDERRGGTWHWSHA